MARKRYSGEDCLKLLREIELHLAAGSDVGTACRSVGISDATYYTWRKKYGGMGRPLLRLSAGTFVRLLPSLPLLMLLLAPLTQVDGP